MHAAFAPGTDRIQVVDDRVGVAAQAVLALRGEGLEDDLAGLVDPLDREDLGQAGVEADVLLGVVDQDLELVADADQDRVAGRDQEVGGDAHDGLAAGAGALRGFHLAPHLFTVLFRHQPVADLQVLVVGNPKGEGLAIDDGGALRLDARKRTAEAVLALATGRAAGQWGTTPWVLTSTSNSRGSLEFAS